MSLKTGMVRNPSILNSKVISFCDYILKIMTNFRHQLKKVIRKMFPKFYGFVANKKHFSKNDNSKSLIYIHIGKCGGSTLLDSLKNSSVVNEKFSYIHRIHVEKPPILKNASYAVVVRNPIQRVISAFNWRFKLVVIEKNRGSHIEYEILNKYKTLNALCEQLYVDGKLNIKVSDEFEKIGHIKESISFYLKPLLDEISPSQLFAVFAAETLNKDIANILSLKNELHLNQNTHTASDDKKFLSKKAYCYLKTYLSDDYLYLSKLLIISKTSNTCKNILLR